MDSTSGSEKMADSGCAPREDGSNNSSGSSNDTTLKKSKGGKIVKSRYMQQYDKNKVAKVNLPNTTVCSGGKAPERTGSGTPTRSIMPSRFKAPTGAPPGALDGTLFVKDNLQSTFLEDHRNARPDLDISVINDKTFQRRTPKALFKAEQPRTPKKEPSPASAISEEAMGTMELQTLLFTYLGVQMQKNLRRLEEKAEKNLLLVCEEREKLQKKAYEQKRKLLLLRREQQLAEVLARQAEVLMPSAAEDDRFKTEYRTFATALDSTRHELPIKHIHIEGSRQHYLDELQRHLAVTESLLAEVMPGWSEENGKAFTTARELEDVVLKIDADLPRTLTLIIDLAFKVSKETSLQNQKVIEDTNEMEPVKRWYFDDAFAT